MREEPQKRERKITEINLPKILDDFFSINNDFIIRDGADPCECCIGVNPKTKTIHLGNYTITSVLGSNGGNRPQHVTCYYIYLNYRGKVQLIDRFFDGSFNISRHFSGYYYNDFLKLILKLQERHDNLLKAIRVKKTKEQNRFMEQLEKEKLENNWEKDLEKMTEKFATETSKSENSRDDQ